jgi:hypothetical protein
MSIRSRLSALFLLVIPVVAVGEEPADAESTTRTGDLTCSSDTMAAFYTNETGGLQHSELNYTVNCGGNWSIWRKPANGPAAQSSCPIIMDNPGKTERCSPLIETGETLYVKGSSEETTKSVTWTLVTTP